MKKLRLEITQIIPSWRELTYSDLRSRFNVSYPKLSLPKMTFPEEQSHLLYVYFPVLLLSLCLPFPDLLWELSWKNKPSLNEGYNVRSKNPWLRSIDFRSVRLERMQQLRITMYKVRKTN